MLQTYNNKERTYFWGFGGFFKLHFQGPVINVFNVSAKFLGKIKRPFKV